MKGFELHLERPWLLLLLLFLSALVIVWAYRRNDLKINRKKGRLWQLILRCLSVLAASLIICGFSVSTNHVPVSVSILADCSDSMGGTTAAMDKTVNELYRQLSRSQQCQVLAFAGDAEPVDVNTSKEITLPAMENGTSTDIAKALNAAVNMLPQNTRRHLILLSDGLETQGNASAFTHTLAGEQIRLDAFSPVDEKDKKEAEIQSFEIPAQVSLGQACYATVTIQSNCDMNAELVLFEEGETLLTRSVELNEDICSVSMNLTPKQAGMRMFTAELRPAGDGIEENNTKSACMNVLGSAKVLLLSDTQASSAWLASLLEADGYTTQWRTPQDAPSTLSALCNYALTVLMDVDQDCLRAGTDQLLKQYVEEYGRSVLTIGGNHTYVYGHMFDTAFEDFLPISLNVKEEESATPVTLLLVIDCSASMGQKLNHSANENATPLEMAKRGAIKCVTEMNQNDYVGVISFSDFCYVLCDVTSASEQDKILNGIANIGTVLGTVYGEALTEAYQQIQDYSTTERNHIIFISDGNPGDKDYQQIVERMREDGITMSTIAVGDLINVDIMQELADIGGGSYSLTQDASDLPNIMVTDAVMQQISYLMEGSYQPNISPGASLLPASTALPALHGYIRAQAKPGAELVISTQDNHPLYAYWRYGEGRVGSFLSDLSGNWSQEWMSDTTAQQTVLAMVADLMPEGGAASSVTTWIENKGSQGVLHIDTIAADNIQSITAEMTSPLGTVSRMTMQPMGGGHYQQMFPMDGCGKYSLSLTLANEDGIQTEQTAAAASYSNEYEAFPEEDSQQLLNTLCTITGGEVISDANDFLEIDLSDTFVWCDLNGILAIIIFISLLAEWTLRRFEGRKRSRKRSLE